MGIMDQFGGGSDFDSEIPVPDNAQFPEESDMEPGECKKYTAKSDFELLSFRMNKGVGPDKGTVFNLRVKSVESDLEIKGEPNAMWFKLADFDPQSQWHEIPKRQIVSLAKLCVGIGLASNDAFDDLDPAEMGPEEWMEFVNTVADYAARYGQTGYVFNGTMFWKREWRTGKPKAYTNVSLYINKCPASDGAPF